MPMTRTRLIGLLTLTAVLSTGCAAELRQAAPVTPARSSTATTAAVTKPATPAPASRHRAEILIELQDLVAAWEDATGSKCEPVLRNHVQYAAESVTCDPHTELAVFDLESDRNDFFAALASQGDTRPWVAGEYWAVNSPALDNEEFARQHGGHVLTPGEGRPPA